MQDATFRWAIPLSLALTTTLLLSGCGGGGGSGGYFPPTTGAGNGVTDAATGAADPYAGFITYVMALLGSAPDTVDAADVSRFDPPATSDTREAVSTP